MLRIARFATVAGAMAFALVACRDAAGPLSTGPTMSPAVDETAVPEPHIVVPKATSQTDEVDWVPLNNPATALHYAWLPGRHTAHARLFVFLPGTGNQPVSYRLFSTEAARAGYHVIGLMYQNDKAIENTTICKFSTDPQCAEKVRKEILTGEALSGVVTVTEGNSIDHRLERLLVYLKKEYPNEQWHKFLKEGKPDWSKIAVGGQSQGAGEAALIARERLVPRVVMLSGPPDQSNPDQSNPPPIDSWVRIGKTQPSSLYALYHFADRLRSGTIANLGSRGFGLEALGSLGVGTIGPWCEPPDTRPLSDWEFGDAHVLVTNLLPRGDGGCEGITTGNPHRSTARDEFTPLDADGKPALLGAWRYLIGDPQAIIDDDPNDGDDNDADLAGL
jgi:hypothetical protein